MQSNQIESVDIKPLIDNDQDYEEIEKRIKALFKREIYIPLIKMFGEPSRSLKNSIDDLLNAIKYGRIQFDRGKFTGRFNSTISKELKSLGAQWDRKQGSWKIPKSSLPLEVRNAISAGVSYFEAKIAKIDQKLSQILPEELADKLNISAHFDKTLWKVDKDFHKSLRNIAITPKLTPEQAARISKDWQHNMKLWIKDWTEKEIVKLREDMQASVFAGNRNEQAIKMIQKSYGSSVDKAKFLARQETRLLLTKFKQTRYEDAGVNEYRWGISNHPIQPKGAPYVKGQVRHDHGVLAGKIFRWNNPPITNQETGARNNPGQDFNCRCFAIPIVKFKK